MCICVCMYIYIYIYTYLSIYLSIHLSLSLSLHIVCGAAPQAGVLLRLGLLYLLRRLGNLVITFICCC